MHRMRRALAAIKMAEMAELGRCRTLADAARAYATEARAQSRTAAPPDSATDMAALSAWQQAQEWRARMAEAAAQRAEEEARPLAHRLARTLGRETVTRDLIAAQDRERARQADRRAEDEVRRA